MTNNQDDHQLLSPGEPEKEPERDLFGNFVEPWRDEWVGMPEFVQEDLTPFKTVYVHFESREDVEAFAKLLGQTITMQTRSIWYPEAEIGHFINKRWVDVAEEPSEEEAETEDLVEVTDLGPEEVPVPESPFKDGWLF